MNPKGKTMIAAMSKESTIEVQDRTAADAMRDVLSYPTLSATEQCIRVGSIIAARRSLIHAVHKFEDACASVRDLTMDDAR